MAIALHAFVYLDKPAKYPARHVSVVYGDQPFLKQLVREKIRAEVLSEGDAEFSLHRLAGESAQWNDVIDELSTVAMFGGGRRVVVVEDADDFVTRHRSRLEDFAAQSEPGCWPGEATSGAAGKNVLLLDVKTWAANTRLYKLVEKHGLHVQCKDPKAPQIIKWLIARTKSEHRAVLDRSAAEMLIEMTGPEPGLLDASCARLAVSVGVGERITAERVRDEIGGWRAKKSFDMLDAALFGDAAEALVQLDRLLIAGEHPVALFGSFSWSLRRFAAATRMFEEAERSGRRPAVRDVLIQAGVQPHRVSQCEKQLRQLGRRRAAHIYRWLLEADLQLKRSHSALPRARLVLERLLVRMSSALAKSAVG
jgi:DNA polymerase-3 subunit delta